MFKKLKQRWLENQKEQVLNAQKRTEKLKALVPVFKKYGVRRAYLFGSLTRNVCSSRSDIDLYVEEVDNKLYWNMLRDLEDAATYDIDLYTQSDEAQFIKKIKERGIKIYESKY